MEENVLFRVHAAYSAGIAGRGASVIRCMASTPQHSGGVNDPVQMGDIARCARPPRQNL